MKPGDWETLISSTRQGKYPNENFVRFVARNFYSVDDRSRIRFLDIGSGVGSNSWFLAHEGFSVTALDCSPAALGSLKFRFEQERFFKDRVQFELSDVETWAYPEDYFDCVFDVNTLCHVKTPPMFSIRDSLKRGGKFFSVAPTHDTWKGRVMEGKDYCRFNDKLEMLELLKPFSAATIRRSEYPDRDFQMRSWIVEASK